jgi:hypothetical protein
MHARRQRQNGRITVSLVANWREGRRVRTNYFGVIGSLADAEPISITDRARFWRELDSRFAAAAARDPRVTPDQIAKVKASLAKRIPPVTVRAESHRRFFEEVVARPLARQTKRKGVCVVSA